MNTSNRFSSATQATTPACVSNFKNAKAWLQSLSDVFHQPPDFNNTEIPAVPGNGANYDLNVFVCNTTNLINVVAVESTKHHSPVHLRLRMGRHEAAWLARALIEGIATNLMYSGERPLPPGKLEAAAALPPPEERDLRGLKAETQLERQFLPPVNRLSTALLALANHTQKLLNNPSDKDNEAMTQICVYAARNALDLTALEQANAEREARHAAERATGHEYHGVRA